MGSALKRLLLQSDDLWVITPQTALQYSLVVSFPGDHFQQSPFPLIFQPRIYFLIFGLKTLTINKEDLKTFTVLLSVGLSFDLCQKCLITYGEKASSRIFLGLLRVCFTTRRLLCKVATAQMKISLKYRSEVIKSHLEVCQNRDLRDDAIEGNLDVYQNSILRR